MSNNEPTKEATADTKPKKPIYKRVWFWIIIVLVVIGIGSGLGSQGSKQSSDTTSTSSSSTQKKEESKTDDSNKTDASQDDLKSKFDSITLGQDSGATKESVEQLMGGKANSTSTQDISGIQSDDLTWNLGVMKTISIGFTNDHAISKSVIGLKESKKITLDEFNQIQNGMSEADVAAVLGDPSSITITDILGTTSSIQTYSGKDLGSAGTVTFTNGAVSGVSNMNLK